MKKLVFILVIAFPLASLHAQSDRESVIKAATNYIDAFYYGDTTKIHQSIAGNIHKYGYYQPKGKTVYEGEAMSFSEMIDYAASVKKRGVNPNVDKFPKKVEVYDVLDKTASAKVTAWWGTDYLLLAKLNDNWVITNIVWQSVPPKNP